MMLWRWSPLLGLLLWGSWKLVSWGAFPWEVSAQVGALLNLFILLLLALGGAWVGMRNDKDDNTDFLITFRQVSKVPLRFALLVTGGLALWYGTIASDGLELRKQRMKDEALALVNDDAQWEAFVEAQGGGVWDREIALAQQIETIDTIYNPALFLGLSLLGLVLSGLVFSAVAALLWRTVWTR